MLPTVDQDRLLGRLATLLSPGGVLAIQAPNNRDEIAYRILADLLGTSPWLQLLKVAAPQPGIEAPAWYIARLRALGFSVSLWETIYYHQMPDSESIVEWMKGTTLTPVLSTLDKADEKRFLGQLSGRIAGAYPPGMEGVIFPFRRMFLVAWFTETGRSVISHS